MRQFLVLVDTTNHGKKILFRYPSSFQAEQFEKYFAYKEGDSQDTQAFAKDKIQTFLASTEYFGLIEKQNLFGFSTDFVLDFFSPSRNIPSNELIIEDRSVSNVYSPCNRPSKDSDELPNSKTLISSFNLLLVLNEQDPAFINYCKKSIVFFAKALELEETHQKEPFFSKHVATIFSKAAEFEKTLNSIPQERAKQMKRTSELINSIEIFQVFQQFYQSVENREEVRFNNHLQFLLQLPSPSILLNPTNIAIKPYQTLLVKRNLCLQILTNVRSLRFAKFVQVINPAYSFDDIAILYNFSLKEVEVYVLHLLIHQKGILLNKLTGDSIFTLSSNYKFDYSSDIRKLSEKFFQKYKVDFAQVITIVNKPQKQSQITKEIPQFGKTCLITLLGQKVIKECEVYLYLKDPKFTLELFSLILKQKQLQSHSASNSSLSQDLTLKSSTEPPNQKELEKTETIIMKVILKSVPEKLCIQEIAWKLGADIQFIWKFVQKYEDHIGYFYIT